MLIVQSLSELIRHHVVQPRHIKSLVSTVVLLLITSSLPRTVCFIKPHHLPSLVSQTTV